MKLVKVIYEGREHWGEWCGAFVRMLAGGPYGAVTYAGVSVPFGACRLLAPCDATKVVAVGKNYADHAKELPGDMPDHPILFLKPATTLVGQDASVVYPDGVGRLDHEAELAFVIKKTAKKVSREDAADYILGYTCFNDLTARDIQRIDGQWARAKSYDGFAPCGPCLVTDVQPDDLAIACRVNGETRQSASTALMVWDVAELMAFITAAMTLYPGDVVTTGTPAGISPMQRGDVTEVDIAHIGVLRTTII